MASKRPARCVDGILVLDKPLGATSNRALQLVKHLLQAEKAGHTGALDPLATGVLPLCFGEATKVSQVLLEADKTYLATIQLGVTTASGDRDGEVLSQTDVPHFSEAEILKVLAQFTGTIMQTAPIYSALKQNGVPQYKLARAGLPVEAKQREITIYKLELVSWQWPELAIDVTCSKGTYIRSLGLDIGNALGVGGHLCALRRTQAGPFTLSQSHTPEALEALVAAQGVQALDRLLLPTDFALQDWPRVDLDRERALSLWQGKEVSLELPVATGKTRVYSGEVFVGIVDITAAGRLQPLRLMKFDPERW